MSSKIIDGCWKIKASSGLNFSSSSYFQHIKLNRIDARKYIPFILLQHSHIHTHTYYIYIKCTKERFVQLYMFMVNVIYYRNTPRYESGETNSLVYRI